MSFIIFLCCAVFILICLWCYFRYNMDIEGNCIFSVALAPPAQKVETKIKFWQTRTKPLQPQRVGALAINRSQGKQRESEGKSGLLPKCYTELRFLLYQQSSDVGEGPQKKLKYIPCLTRSDEHVINCRNHYWFHCS